MKLRFMLSIFQAKPTSFNRPNTMESDADNKTIIPNSDVVIIPHLEEDVLDHIATFLDFQSLRQFRLVSREWNAAAVPILMKRGYYNLTHRYCRYDRSELIVGVTDYTSWKISHSVFVSDGLLYDNELWKNVKSLTIHQFLPLSREFHRWAWQTIQNRCPNLQELSVIFEPGHKANLDRKVLADFQQAILRLPNKSFPNDISGIRNLTSVKLR
jgi:hypothetical protein